MVETTSESENDSDLPTPGKSSELRRALGEISQLKLETTGGKSELIHYNNSNIMGACRVHTMYREVLTKEW